MWYKAFSKRLTDCGWTITDEAHDGDIYAHYFKYDHPADDGERTIEMVCDNTKNGTPGRILKVWQGGKLCRV